MIHQIWWWIAYKLMFIIDHGTITLNLKLGSNPSPQAHRPTKSYAFIILQRIQQVSSHYRTCTVV